MLLHHATAFGLTLAVEVPLFVAALTLTWGVPWWRAAGAAIGVNLITHPLLWWSLLPLTSEPWYLWLVGVAEATVWAVEWLLLSVVVRRWAKVRPPSRTDLLLLLLTCLGVNLASVLAGLVLAV